MVHFVVKRSAINPVCAGLEERQAMAAAFARLSMRVLWRLSMSEVPNDNAIADLNLSNNTKAGLS